MTRASLRNHELTLDGLTERRKECPMGTIASRLCVSLWKVSLELKLWPTKAFHLNIMVGYGFEAIVQTSAVVSEICKTTQVFSGCVYVSLWHKTQVLGHKAWVTCEWPEVMLLSAHTLYTCHTAHWTLFIFLLCTLEYDGPKPFTTIACMFMWRWSSDMCAH